MDAAFALLTDGRFPSGGHAHSGGIEAASRHLGVRTVSDVEDFITGRLHTVGLTEASLIAAAGFRVDRDGTTWAEIDREVDCRIVSPSLGRVSRSLGRQWLRAGRRIWPEAALDTMATIHAEGPHQVTAFAAVVMHAGLDLERSVVTHLHHLVATSAGAAVRLHGLDPYEVQKVQVTLAPHVEQVAEQAVANATLPLAEIPGCSAPLIDVLADLHARGDRLFQS